MRRLSLIAAACLALAACNKGPKTDPNAKAAGGEVLPGTVSDAMIDLDGSTAQPQLAPHKADKGDAKDKKAPADATAAADEGDAAEADSSPTKPAPAVAKPVSKPDAQ